MREYQIVKTEQKALNINLDDSIYGTFAEIGAGQEVARNFFQVGAAVGTIAKTMSAYDKTYSDKIYGIEDKGRYVCESRVYKMMDHEYDLLVERLEDKRENTNFFVFADTVAAINYQKTIRGHGWLGVRFQLTPHSAPNDLVVHVRLLDNDNRLQQEAIGVLGVNMIYACYFYNHNLEHFVQSLADGLEGRVKIDLIRLNGPDFRHADDRLLSLYIVKFGLSEVSMFGPDKQSVHGSEFLYKKSVMVVRGHYRPPTLATEDALSASQKQFIEDEGIDPAQAFALAEITLDGLRLEDKIDEQDFLDRTELLCALGQTVIVSNCENHQKLINYLSDFKIQQLGLVIGVNELLEIINQKYYENQDGRILVAFGELFTRNIKVYAYPALNDKAELITAKDLKIPEGIKFLYKHLIDSEQIVEIKGYDPNRLSIFPWEVLDCIQQNKAGWEDKVPARLVRLIKEKELFSVKRREINFPV